MRSGKIAFNTFLSATESSSTALIYTGNAAEWPGCVSILFEIEVDLTRRQREKPFAD
ncbi:unnamed protein product, partial [Rotaria sp. Silwood1]